MKRLIFINGIFIQIRLFFIEANSKCFFDMGAKGLTAPDGMTIDSNDNLYVAVYNGNGVYRINAM